MNKYLKLVNFELNRFMKIYIILVAITIISQITGVIVKSKSYLKEANEIILKDGVPIAAFVQDFGTFSFRQVSLSLWFVGPVFLCIAVLIVYIFFIWYRDWFGKNTFIYRLLMLPTMRLNVYLAKATTIFLMVLGLISLQLILLPIESSLIKMMIPIDFRADLAINEMIATFDYLRVLFPLTLIDFMIHYGIGFTVVFVLFTAILFERSYRLKGILFGILYCALAVVIFLWPLFVVAAIQRAFLYPIEHFILQVVLGLIVIGLSLWVSHFLLKKKITV